MVSGRRVPLLVALVTVSTIIATERGQAHKPITSKYTFNDDVFPILRERCGRCHVTGGVAPMSLMTYKAAFPWSESIRTELIAGTMPPWNAERIGGGGLRNLPPIGARELDTLLTWATGGGPEGEPSRTPPPVELKNEWRLGPPDLMLPIPADVTLAAGRTDEIREFIIPTSAAEDRWVRAADLLPGAAAMVRSAVIAIKPAAGDAGSTGDRAAERLLALWVPGHDPVPAADGTGFRLPSHAELTVRIHYKKTWSDEQQTLTDRSAVGLYFGTSPMSDISNILLESPPVAGERLTFSRTLTEDVKALAVRPEALTTVVGVQVEAILPDGSRVPLVRGTLRPQWAQRYWLDRPLAIPKGSRIDVTLTPGGDDLQPPAASPAVDEPPGRSPVRLVLNVVP
jgi:hypothetical protein